MAWLMASTWSATISWKRSRGSSWKKRDRSMARSGQSSWRTRPRAWIERVLLPQLAGEGPDVPLVGVVVRVEQDGRGGAGRDRRHEALGEPPRVGGRRRQEHPALGFRLAEVGVLDLGDGLRRRGDAGRRPAPRREQGGVVGVLADVARQPAPALPAEPAHPAGHVRREPGARLLAVVADVDPDGELPVDGPAHGRLGLAGELRLVDAARRGPGAPGGPAARAGRGRLPTWVVSMRSSLRCMRVSRRVRPAAGASATTGPRRRIPRRSRRARPGTYHGGRLTGRGTRSRPRTPAPRTVRTPHRDRQREPAGPDAAGIHEQHAVPARRARACGSARR